MKYLFILLLTFAMFYNSAYSQKKATIRNHYRLIEGSEGSRKFRAEIFSDIDTTWNKWKLRGYNFGFKPAVTPMYTMIDGIVCTPYMVQVRGNENERGKKRWGYHVFEGYARDNESRITLLVNKHVENERPVAEMYYYSNHYGHSDLAYNWFRVGSDVRQHSFMFSRDRAIFYGSLKLTNTLTLGKIGADDIRKSEPEGDSEMHYEQSAKHVTYKALKESEDGAMFYDRKNDIVAIKINGEWMKLVVEALPDNINYDFD